MFRLATIGLAVFLWTNGVFAADVSAEQQKIRDIDAKWVAAVASGDAAAVAQFYAPDGALLAPHAPIARGRDAIQAAWAGLLKMKDFHLTFAPTKISVATGNDMAYEIGTYTLRFAGDSGPVKDNGKYVVVWTRQDGHWRASADIFNSNGKA